ncbi:MAG: DUF4367 domain-containing protein [Lachnospiraceae bacterium]|nr:DUF4367 domain-containing protein [Lachnospiraceae bacterium]
MSKKSIDELLETYVPSCMDKAVDHYEEESKKIDSPSDQYTKRMEKLIRREELKKRYHIPIKNSRRVAAMILICLIAGMTVTLKVDAVRMKVYDWVKTIYEEVTLYQYDIKEESGQFVPIYPTYIPDGFTLEEKTNDENTLILVYSNKLKEEIITITEFWIIDGDRIYENNEFIRKKNIKIDGKKAMLGYTEDGIMIRWDEYGCRMGIDSNCSDENELIQMCESLEVKQK